MPRHFMVRASQPKEGTILDGNSIVPGVTDALNRKYRTHNVAGVR